MDIKQVYKTPPRITYSNRPDYYKRLVSDAAKNVQLSGRATAQLAFYCDQADGFTPALKLIERKTGIASNKVSEVRQELSRKGMIQYDAGEGFVYIEWERLRIFALLNKPLGKRESMTGRFAPVSYHVFGTRKPEKKIHELIAEVKPTHLQRLTERPTPRALSPDELSLFQMLEDMTESEYAAQVKAFPEYDPAEQRPMIPPE